MLTRPSAFIVTIVGVAAGACASAPLLTRADSRQQRYLATHRGLSADVVAAIEAGHVSPGMDRDQVVAVLGVPVRKSEFSSSHAEIWMYPAGRFHQDAMHAHGATLFRLVFLGGRLSTIEPI